MKKRRFVYSTLCGEGRCPELIINEGVAFVFTTMTKAKEWAMSRMVSFQGWNPKVSEDDIKSHCFFEFEYVRSGEIMFYRIVILSHVLK